MVREEEDLLEYSQKKREEERGPKERGGTGKRVI